MSKFPVTLKLASAEMEQILVRVIMDKIVAEMPGLVPEGETQLLAAAIRYEIEVAIDPDTGAPVIDVIGAIFRIDAVTTEQITAATGQKIN